MPNPRNYPGTSVKRSPFDTVRTSSRGFQKFTRSVKAAAKAFDPFERFKSAFDQFDPLQQQGERVINVSNQTIRVVGLPPPSAKADPLGTGVLQVMDDQIMAEIAAIAKAAIER